MERLSVIKFNTTAAILERLSLSLYIDSSVRALSAQSLPVAASLTAIDFKGHTLRDKSAAYQTLFSMLRPDATDLILSRDETTGRWTTATTKIKSHTLDGANVSSKISKCLSRDVELASMLQSIHVDGQEGKSVTKLEQVHKVIAEIWSSTGILTYMVASESVVADQNDPDNAISMRATLDEWLSSNRPTDIIEKYLTSFFVGNGTGQTQLNPLNRTSDNQAAKLNKFEYTSFVKPTDAESFYFGDLITWLSSTGGTPEGKDPSPKTAMINSLYSILTDVEIMKAVPALAKKAAELWKVTVTQPSDNKDLSKMMTEVERVQDLNAIRTFVAMQAWVGLMQTYLSAFVRPSLTDYVKTVLPTLASTYDIDNLLGTFLGRPVGANTAKMLTDILNIDTLQHQGSKTVNVFLDDHSIKAENALSHYIGMYKTLIPYLYSLNANKKLWELYEKGASLMSTGRVTRKGRIFDIDNVPVSFVQMGITSGDRFRNLDDLQLTALFDWGVNRFNSSARSIVRWNGTVADPFSEPYYYGEIDYPSYLKNRASSIANIISASTEPSGNEIAVTNIPAIPFRRRSTKVVVDNMGLFIDSNIVNKGPVSLLPVPAAHIVDVTQSLKIDVMKKELIGKYEIKIDMLPLTFSGVPQSPLQKGSLSRSILPETLMISPKSLQMMASSSNNVNILSRFLHAKDNTALSCAAITTDPLFIDMMNCFFYIPSKSFVSEDITLLYITHSFDASVESEIKVEVHSRKLPAYRILTSPKTEIISSVPGRLIGSALYMDSGMPTYQGEDDVTFNFGSK